MNFSSRQQQANDRELPTMWLKIQLFSRLYNAKLLHFISEFSSRPHFPHSFHTSNFPEG